MEQIKDNSIFYILKIIENSDCPLGSGIISEQLKIYGFDVSEATVGRTLRELDLNGYTEKVGFRGRTLTKKGKNRLKELEQEYELKQYGNELIDLLKVEKKNELIDILIARKAIERELARLAAANAEDEDIRILQNIVNSHDMHIDDYMAGAIDDVKFHKHIAKMSKNRILEAAMDLIRQQGQLSPVLGYIRKKVKSNIVSDHKEILKAISQRKPDDAEKAMVKHIENLIRDVNKYWKEVNNV